MGTGIPRSERAALLQRTELFGGLDGSLSEALARRAVERRLEPNEILFVAGDEAEGLFVIAEGSVRAFRSNPDGREQVIHTEHAGATIAEVPVFDGGSYPSTVAADGQCVVLFIARRDILDVCRSHPQVALAAAKLLANRLRRCAQLVEALSLKEVGQRIAMYLLQSADAGAISSCFTMPLTHNQLAVRIGTVREVVTRTLSRLQENGLIHVSGRKISVPDIARLRRYLD